MNTCAQFSVDFNKLKAAVVSLTLSLMATAACVRLYLYTVLYHRVVSGVYYFGKQLSGGAKGLSCGAHNDEK